MTNVSNIRTDAGERRRRWQAGDIVAGILITFSALTVAVVIAGVVLLRPFSIPSGSMIPTLKRGDYVLVSRFIYDVSRPRRGDVVVFKLPRDNAIDYIKRIVGLPGDTVQMKEGRLYINGAVVAREPIAKVRAEDQFGHDTEVPTYKETLPGGSTDIVIEIQGDHGFNDNTEAFKVPPDNYFVLGDNRDNSTDSRVAPDQGGVGFVPGGNMVGRAEFIVFSKDQAQAFKPVH